MNSRQLKLLKSMLSEHSYQPASYYAKRMSVSARTIYSDLDIINEFIKKNGGEVQRKPSAGVKIVGDISIIQTNLLSSNLLDCDIYDPSNRRLIIIKLLAFTNQDISLDYLSEAFIVSKTSIYKDIHVLNEIIDGTDSYIESSKHELALIGNEETLQKAIKAIVFYFSNNESDLSFTQVIKLLFDEESIQYVDSLLKDEIDGFARDASNYYYRSLVSVLLIHLSRIQIDHQIQSQEELLLDSIKYLEVYPIAESLVNKLSQTFEIEYQIEDKTYITRQLYAHRIQKNIVNIDDNIKNSVKILINEVSMIEDINLMEDRHLLFSLYQHFPPMLMRLEKGIQIENPLLDSIKIQYMELFSILWYLLGDFEKKYNVSFNDHEVSLILIHFQIALEKQSESKNILIICQYGMSSAQLIYQKVKRILPNQDNIEIANANKLHKVNLKNVDLIITTIDLGDFKRNYIKVSPIFSSQDYKSILNAYSLLLSEQNNYSPSEKIKAPTLLEFMNKDLINLHIDSTSKEELLDFMITQLEQKKMVKKEFRQSIFEREKLGDTNLENGIALPHANPNTVIESSISFTTLNKPIKWGKGKVQLIVMITFNDQDTNKIKLVIEELFPVINNKKLVDELLEIKDKTQWINRFIN
ncbi:BglG family transcription antiterminator [Aerococcus mictus]|uniref:BglG family transcription antiterminator n=1 Tax=Aerococcus mictus TaxID=2976810 RepID=UPI0015EF2E85|nr:PTS sugar transporter subunit IIA [Aerococcus mictus]WMF96124.1 PTS sugar transporter subunit IIA [Aerococcus mictus]